MFPAGSGNHNNYNTNRRGTSGSHGSSNSRGNSGGGGRRRGRRGNGNAPGHEQGITNPPNNNGPNTNNESRQQNRAGDVPFERKGPVFGFKRLHGFLTSSTDEVILSIDRDLKDWQTFLESDDLTLKSDTLLILVVQILAEKISGETILTRQQIGILIRTNTDNFISKVTGKCQQILMGNDRGNINRRPQYGSSDFTEVDQSPKTFLKNLHTYSAFMAKKMPESAVDYILNIVAAAYGAVRELADTDDSFSNLMLSFKDLKQEIQNLIKKRDEAPKVSNNYRRYEYSEQEEKEMHAMEAPDDYKLIPIVPSVKELLLKEEVFLRPNKTTGAYVDANHYLDVQFRLLREDFVQPLKKGIQNFMKNRFEYLSGKKRIPLGEIRVYPDVQFISSELVRDVFVYKVQLAESSSKENYKKIRWEKSKRLLTGSLLVFTSNYFKNAYFAVVASRKTDELTKGIVSVVWEGDRPSWERDDIYLMVECEVYFEAYRHTLQILKELDLQSFPMCKFIVAASSEVGPPKYLEETENLMKLVHQNHSEHYLSPLMQNQWPTPQELGLDINQFVAFQAALTKEFAIIQGPPGTGKTFLGLKIAEVFLKNESIWREADKGPILAVCYTNHALDQFLEGILDIFKKMDDKDPSIVRVGGRCKSDKLAEFSLSNVVRRKSRSMPKHFWPNKYEVMGAIDELRNQRSALMETVMALKDIQGIINFEKLDVWKNLMIEFPSTFWTCLSNLNWFGLTDELFKVQNFQEDKILASWFDIRPFSQGNKKPATSSASSNANVVKQQQQTPAEQESDDDEDFDLDELLENRILDDIYAEVDSKAPVNMGRHLSYIAGFSIKDCDKIIKDSEKLIGKAHSEARITDARRQNILEIEFQKTLAHKRRSILDKLFSYYKNNMIVLPDVKQLMVRMKTDPSFVPSLELYRITKPQRWALFFECVERARALSALQANEIETELLNEQKKLQQIQRFADGWILQNSKVVGMTTTGAAKYNDLIRMMKSRIVIVEEAAEVLEAHIVTCITEHCEHLILIGDHRQLRPSTTVYDLAKKYRLDISLFERMINNNLNCYPLKVQHRMRPEIANLVVGTIYQELFNHQDVYQYPPVIGLTKNLYFISHNELEKSDSDSLSKSNEFEAKFLASLCRYLILQGYSMDKITVLTTYMGQMFLLKKRLGELPNCRGVRVTCVDNFQGEENDIILLSLVRSNMDSKIGFLNIENRVCVALSRAREGLFIVGNLKLLASKSKLWSQIKEKLEKRDECGTSLTLECQLHGILSQVQNPADFNRKAPDGGCSLPCDTKLECTHKCVKVCHVTDRLHKLYRCHEPCLKQCINQHDCAFPCFKNCPPCNFMMKKRLPCQHEKIMPCHQSVEDIQCLEIVLKTLPCGHKENLACHRDAAKYICKIEVDKELPCKHIRNLQCHIDVAGVTCKVIVEKTLVPCGHLQMAECRFSPDVIKCDTIVTKTLPDCKHKMDVRCQDANKPVICKNSCSIRLNCGHACTKICHTTEDPQHLAYVCKKDCAKSCPAGHNCQSKHKCHTPCPPCKFEVTKKIVACGHTATMFCYVDPTNYECLLPCEIQLNCHHKCQNLCFQPCGPCEVNVKKRILECRHPIDVPCSTHPTRNMCLQLVRPMNFALCGHDTLVPCKISSTATRKEIMEICTHPCATLFPDWDGGCDHTCSGTCGTCIQGRFHEKCQERCGKTLVCGHVCEFPCSKSCPPCEKLCVMKCEHSVCTKNCGTPCQDCSEKCPWQCPHKQCTKLCREMCDREPCDEPCSLKLKCGHPCIGFCGEICPPHCRVCDKKELTEFILYGTEGDEDSRFVYLPDCNHSIEVEGLTYHLNLDDGEIGLKRCPRCNTVIRYCRRFSNVLQNRLKDVILVKNKIFGNQKKVTESQSVIIPKLLWDDNQQWARTFPTLHALLLDMVVHKVPVKRGVGEARTLPKKVDESTMGSIKFIFEVAEESIRVLSIGKTELSPPLHADLLARYRNLFAKVMERKFPLSPTETRDIGRELQRLHDLNQLYLRRSSPRFTPGRTPAIKIYERLEMIVLSHNPYTGDRKPELHALLKELEEILKTGLGITEMERKMIVQALNMRQGHWFKCPNGHPYVITECGGAMQEGTCNECGARIGGGSHQLRRDNAFAPEMDGATAPLWPNTLD